MKNMWKIIQHILLILTFLITIFLIFSNNDLWLIIRGILLTLFFGTMILEDKLGNKSKTSGTTFEIFRTITIIIVLLIDFKF